RRIPAQCLLQVLFYERNGSRCQGSSHTCSSQILVEFVIRLPALPDIQAGFGGQNVCSWTDYIRLESSIQARSSATECGNVFNVIGNFILCYRILIESEGIKILINSIELLTQAFRCPHSDAVLGSGRWSDALGIYFSIAIGISPVIASGKEN